MKIKLATSFLILIILIICILFIKSPKDLKYTNLKNILSFEQRLIIKKYFFQKKFNEQYKYRIKETNFKKSLKSFQTESKKVEILNNFISPSIETMFYYDMILNKYKIKEGFYSGIKKKTPGSGYIDFHNNNLFLISSRGITSYGSQYKDKFIFKQIKNNIEKFINLDQFIKNRWFSIKDLYILDNKIFISYTEEIEKNCWNTSVIFTEINYEYLKFKKLFSPKNCIHAFKNIDNEFNAQQSGGRIISLNKDKILLTIGDYRSRYLSQDSSSINGKILKIDINDKSYEIISMGHRNPQGLFYDKQKKYLLSTEHGPKGGDEINLININKNNLPNYGWPIVSYGEHYEKKTKKNYNKFIKYPLLKSHRKNNFIEPLKYFVPSIGISEIVKANKNIYIASSLKNKSIYTFKINEENEIINFEKIFIGERIRDLIFNNNKLYLFFESTATLGIINF